MSKPSPLSRSNSSESLVESSSQKTPTKDEQSKSTAPPVMKNKKNAQREAYKASANVSSSSSSTHTKKNHDIGKSFKTEIDTARQTNEIKLQEKFSKRIGPGSVLNVNGLGEKEIQDLADWLSSMCLPIHSLQVIPDTYFTVCRHRRDRLCRGAKVRRWMRSLSL